MVTYPMDWEEKSIDQAADRYDRLRIPVASNLRRKGKTPYYGANGVLDYIDGYTHDGEFVLIAEDGANDLKRYPIHYVNGKVWINNHAHVLKGKNGVVNTKFLSYVLRKVDFESILVGGTRVKLNSKSLMNIVINIPKYSEQKEIAKTLSDFDTYINDLEKLIEKKKSIREGALKDLLTGRTIIKGFEGGRAKYCIEEITNSIITGGTPSTMHREYYGGDIPWLSSTEIHQKLIVRPTTYITEMGLQNSSSKIAPADSVLIALAGQGKTRGTAAYLTSPMAISQSLAALVTSDKCNPKFLYYLIESMYFDLRELSSGDGGRGGLNKTLIKKVKVNIPTDIVEQTEITKTLQSMDDEIENLELERDKIIQIRDGAMDDLLTGRIRLTD